MAKKKLKLGKLSGVTSGKLDAAKEGLKQKRQKQKLKRLEKLELLAKPVAKEESLRPESKAAKGYNKASDKTKQIGGKEVKTPTPKKGLLGKRINVFAPIKWFFGYLASSYRELKSVTWLSRGENWKLTGVVFIFSIAMAMFLFGVDSLFTKMFEVMFLN